MVGEGGTGGGWWPPLSGPLGREVDAALVSLSPQVPVPRHSVGVVIGRSGEMIKKIQNDAGVRIQFKQGQAEPGALVSHVGGQRAPVRARSQLGAHPTCPQSFLGGRSEVVRLGGQAAASGPFSRAPSRAHLVSEFLWGSYVPGGHMGLSKSTGSILLSPLNSPAP